MSPVPVSSDSAHARGPTPLPSARPSPTVPPAVADPNAMACLTDDTEQIVLFERWAGNEVRSWVASTDRIVPGPLDPALVPVPVFSSHVIGLGVCGARSDVAGAQPAARLIDIRAIIPGDAEPRAVALGGCVPITAGASGPEPAILYGPPTSGLLGAPSGSPNASPAASATGALPFWPTSSYAIGFRFDSDDPGLIRWLRIDLLRGSGAAG